MNTAEVLIKCLEAEGVKYIYGIPGEENLEVMRALKNSSIQFVTVRHEQGAAFMADVYGRLTGKAGVCLSTLGPGATNLMTGIADANSDGAPLVAITGQVGTERMHLTSHQYLDLVNMFEPVTKRSKQVVRPDSVNEIVRIAFKYAQSEKPGASAIDLPENIARMEVTDPVAQQPIRPQHGGLELADDESIRQACRLIEQAQRPVILAGHSAVRNHAAKALNDFARRLRIPVINTMMAKGLVPWDSPYCLWTIGIPQNDYQNFAIDQADLVICVGYDIVEFAPGRWNKKRDHQIIHIDARSNHVNKLYQPDVEVIGNLSYSLEQISKYSGRKDEPEWAFALRERMQKERAQYTEDNSFPMKPQRILQDVRKVMDSGDILVSDVGAHKMWVGREYHCSEPNTCIISNGFATMGIGVPGAISAKLTCPEKKVLTVTGDGGFMMNVQELETAVRMKLPIVVLIFDDEHYGLIKWKEEEHYGNDNDGFGVSFGNPDFVKLAESFHMKGYRIERAQDLVPTLQEAFAQDGPVIVDCPVDYSENMKLSHFLQELRLEEESIPGLSD